MGNQLDNFLKPVSSLPSSNRTCGKLRIKKGPITAEYTRTQNILGEGANGHVIQCFHNITNILYALKELPDNRHSRKEVEIHYFASSHKNIVPLVDVFAHKKTLYLLMECMHGGELFKRIHQRSGNAYSEKETAELMFQLCSAVQHLHNLGIAHRDIKPENMLFTDNSPQATLKLTDFGFAKIMRSSNTKFMSTPVYTAYYAPPEVLANIKVKHPYGKLCDIWSIGVIMYILLCGYPPFSSRSTATLSPGMEDRIKQAKYQFFSPEWDKISSEAKQLIENMLKINPVERPSIDDVIKCKWITSNVQIPYSSEEALISTEKKVTENNDFTLKIPAEGQAKIVQKRKEKKNKKEETKESPGSGIKK